MNLITPQKKPFIQPKIYNKTNYALSFDGVDDYASSNIPTIDETGFTFEIKIKTSGKNDYAGVIGEGGAAAYDKWLFRENNKGDYDFFIANSSSGGNITVSGSKISDDILHHIAGTYNGTDLKLYIEGVLEVSSTFSSAIFSSSSLAIGRYEGGHSDFYYYNGLIDEVRIWNTAKTQQEIQENMNKELTGSETGLVAYYKMNEGSGSTLTDSAGNNDGEIIGATWQEVDY